MEDIKIYKGNIIFTKTKDEFTTIEGGYIVVSNNKVVFTTKSLPKEYSNYEIIDYGNRIIIPGLNDMHLHAPQYPNRGLCLDIQLIDWLFDCTFPEEAKFSNIDYVREVYKVVIKELWRAGSLRSLIYNTIHKEATELLLDMMIESGLGAYVGKVNMDIESPPYLREDTEQSLIETEEILIKYQNKSPLVKPIIAPRFVPSCSAPLLGGLGLLAQKYSAPVMSHLSEEITEINIVRDMYPNFPTYGNIYDYFGLFGQTPTVMAHCIYSTDPEIALIKQNNVYVAHCPTSNCNLGSGMMATRKFVDMNINIGLGCDVSGGGIMNLFTIMSYAISVSKMIYLFSNKTLPPLKTHEAFYFATKGGGSFFGKVGSFEPGYEFDALVIDDSNLDSFDYSLYERIQRLIFLGDDRNIMDRYVAGKKIDEPTFD